MKCQGPKCRKSLKGRQKKFCSEKCKKAFYWREKNNKPKEIKHKSEDSFRGPHYEEFVLKYAEALENGDITQAQISTLLGCNQSSVSRMFSA